MMKIIDLLMELIHYVMVPGIMILIIPAKLRRIAPFTLAVEALLTLIGVGIVAFSDRIYTYADTIGYGEMLHLILPHYWLVFLFASAVLMTLSYRTSWVVGVFCFLVAYCDVDFYTGVQYLILDFFSLDGMLENMLRVILAAVFVAAAYYIFRQHMTEKNVDALEKKHKFTVGALLVISFILFELNISSGISIGNYMQLVPNYISMAATLNELAGTITQYIILRSVVESAIVLFSLKTLLQYGKADIEHELFSTLYDQEKNQYRQFRENVDYINARYHDLKHCLNLLSKDRASAEQLLNDVRNNISFLETEIDSGNETLNNIITDRQMLCLSKSIELRFMTDGTDFKWIDSVDLYIIFCNILDNAIEYLEGFDGERVIELDIRSVHQMVFIHQENSLIGNLEMDGKFPLSTKGKKHDHGFGVKSIAVTAEKYGGSVNVSTENSKYEINIFIPRN